MHPAQVATTSPSIAVAVTEPVARRSRRPLTAAPTCLRTGFACLTTSTALGRVTVAHPAEPGQSLLRNEGRATTWAARWPAPAPSPAQRTSPGPASCTLTGRPTAHPSLPGTLAAGLADAEFGEQVVFCHRDAGAGPGQRRPVEVARRWRPARHGPHLWWAGGQYEAMGSRLASLSGWDHSQSWVRSLSRVIWRRIADRVVSSRAAAVIAARPAPARTSQTSTPPQ